MIELLKDTDPLKKVSEEVLVEEDAGYNLVVWNDDVNTFDWVIKALVEICHHSEEQAEQCALIIHLRGKYAVKQGDFDTLKPMCEGIIDRGINATIEEVAL
jgi:ATP-dependent Clp protease adaptor protein ClpS